MKSWVIWGLVLLVCIGFVYLQWITNPTRVMDNLRVDFAKMAEERNRKVELKEHRIIEFYHKADHNLQEGISYIDSILAVDKSIDKWEKSNLHTIVGETLYDNDSIELALRRFETSESISFSSPRSQANKAGCYVKLGDFEKGMELLNRASETNYDYKWYKGNLYEVMDNREMAIMEYSKLFEKDTTIYEYCSDRIKEIVKSDTKLFSELFYKDRRKRVYIFSKPSETNSNGPDIRKIEIEIRDDSTQQSIK